MAESDPAVEGPGVVLSALAQAAQASGAGAALDAILDRLRGALEADEISFYAEEAGGGLSPRVRRPDGPGTGPGAAPEILVPARFAGMSLGAVGVTLPAGRTLGPDERVAVEAAARIAGLVVRNDDLVRGIGDRARELDRQAVHLDALTRVARRVAQAADDAEAHVIVARETRELLHADTAVLLLEQADGTLSEVATDGPAAEHPASRHLQRLALRGGAVVTERQAVMGLWSGREGAAAPIGVLVVTRMAGEPIGGRDLEGLRRFADHAADALTARGAGGSAGRDAPRRSLAAAIVLAQEDERRRVAEGLHDGPVQELVGVGLMLDALADALNDAPADLVADVNRAGAAAREAVRALRRAIADLHPMALEELGFAAAVRSLLERAEWRGARIEFDLDAAEELAETDRVVAFRIVQEAVANILRHARARRVSVAATAAPGSVVLEVRDDGVGFEPGGERPGAAQGHLGLAAAQERATLAGGTLEISSARGTGTTVRLTLPARAATQDEGEAPRSSSADSSDAASANRSSTTT